MSEVPPAFRDLFEKQTIAHVATLMPDGGPQVTPVWVDYDEDRGLVLFNTETGRQKERNLRNDDRVAVSMTDPENPYRYLTVRGRVVEITEEGAVDHIDELARRYMDVEEYPYKDGEEGARVTVAIDPEHVATGE